MLKNVFFLLSSAWSKRFDALSGYIDHFITSVTARCMVGADSYQHPELIDLFLKFNTDVDKAMGAGSFLPTWLRPLSGILLDQSYKRFRRILIPIIKKRRVDATIDQGGLQDFMPFILDVVDDDNRASDLVTISVWIGLRNLQIALTSTLLDMIDVPGLTSEVASSLESGASVENLDTFDRDGTKNTPWQLLRRAMFESIRLCGPATGPARIIAAKHAVGLASDPAVHLPPKQVATLSSYYSHRLPVNWGLDAAVYRPGRFAEQDPDIGSTSFITWGLKGPHTCPGRWFTQEAICVMMKALLERYEFQPEERGLSDGDKYEYHAGVVTRVELPVLVTRRD